MTILDLLYRGFWNTPARPSLGQITEDEENKDTSAVKNYKIKRNSVRLAADVYNSYTLEEVKAIHPAMVTLWRIGRRTNLEITGYNYNYKTGENFNAEIRKGDSD
jgi:hypothetical protein